MEDMMWEYHVFLHAPNDPAWGPRSAFSVYAPSDECVRDIFPNADRIYRFSNGVEKLVRIL
jgi:hypothetical protein